MTQSKRIIFLSYAICLTGLAGTLWISYINLLEVTARAKGHYTFFSQRARLTDDEAVIYFSLWTLLFIFICSVVVRHLLKKKYINAIVYAVVLLLLMALSVYVDRLLYHQLA